MFYYVPIVFSGNSWYIELDKEEIIIAINREKMERVILNLLSNAIKFTPPSVLITVNMWVKDSHVKIRVKDSGLGIAVESKESVGTSLTIRLPIKPLVLNETKGCEINLASNQWLEVELSNL